MRNTIQIIIKILIVLFVLLSGVILSYYLYSKKLTVSYYKIEEADIEQPFRVVHLTDLHEAEFGENNNGLIKRVSEQKPDMIVMTGDMINRDRKDLSQIKLLVKELVKIAPVYFGYGNHEADWEKINSSDFHDELSETGAVVLNNEYLDIDFKDNKLRIAGYMGYYWQPHMATCDEKQQQLESVFYGEFQDTDRYKILLNHIPTQWVDWEYINVCHVDVVFCGHYHGGVIRIPIIDRGLFAPYVGWFPPYTKGIYRGKETTCVLSAGLGSEYHIPRINNPPEIVVVDFVSD